ncbi:MAG: peptidylprolyl isomerase, partial [Bacteroidota bacterium]
QTTLPDLRMHQVLAIGRYTGPQARSALLKQLDTEPDWRVRVNILKALANYPYTTTREAAMGALDDSHQLVSESAADLILANGRAEDATTYWGLARDSFPWQTRYKLYRAANRYLPIYFSDYRGSINYQLQQRFQQANNPYHRVAILHALSDFPWNYRIIQELGFNDPKEVVRTAAVQALAYISGREDFDAFFRNSARRVRAELAVYLRTAIESADAGMIYEAAQALQADANLYKTSYPNLDWAKTTLAGLALPQKIESYRALEEAITKLEGRPSSSEPIQADYNHPIDWEVINSAGATPTVRIHTERGNITLELWPELTPGSVSSFLQLATEGFYRNKPFHRVVPNFVAQGGDPRGDGYGATDFSLRTETPSVHWDRSGLIGLASAGRDTEGVQFFLTHSGTPHLDGRYTAFGEVIEGQEVVDALQVGDIIERVEIR